MIRQLKSFYKYYMVRRPHTGPVLQKGFRMHRLSIDLVWYKQQLLSRASGMKFSIITTITHKKRRFPVYQVDFKGKTPKYRLLVFAAVHGDEVASALAIPELLKDIQQNKSFYDEWSIRIVTPVNPVGLFYKSRYDKYGYDLNRDFKHFKTRGARLQRDVLHGFKPDIIVSLHEGPQSGFFAFASKSTPKIVQLGLVKELKAAKIKRAVKNFFGIRSPRPGIVPHNPFFVVASFLFGVFTLGRYAERQGIPVITTESCWRKKDLFLRIKPHIITIKSVIKYYDEED